MILPTSTGKSMAFILPASYAREAVTIVIAPLRSLSEDVVRRYMKFKLTVVLYGNDANYDAASILVVIPESIRSNGFVAFMNRIQASSRLDRIIVDECYMALAND